MENGFAPPRQGLFNNRMTTYPTIDSFAKVFKKNPKVVADISDNPLAAEMYMLAVKHDGDNLGFIPKDKQTPEMWMAAVQQNGHALQYIPKEQQTPDMWLAAIKQDATALCFVPKALRTMEMLEAAVSWYEDNYYEG